MLDSVDYGSPVSFKCWKSNIYIVYKWMSDSGVDEYLMNLWGNLPLLTVQTKWTWTKEVNSLTIVNNVRKLRKLKKYTAGLFWIEMTTSQIIHHVLKQLRVGKNIIANSPCLENLILPWVGPNRIYYSHLYVLCHAYSTIIDEFILYVYWSGKIFHHVCVTSFSALTM